MVRHEFRPGGAIQANRQRPKMRNRRVEGFDVLPGEHRAHGFDGDRNHHRHLRAQVTKGALNAQHGGFQIQRILRRFDEQQLDSPLEQPLCLGREGID